MMRQPATKEKKGGRLTTIGLLILAILSSIALWAYVMVINDPQRTKTIRNIQPTFLNEEEVFSARDLIIVQGRKQSLTLTFVGKISDLNQLTEQTVSIEADLADITSTGNQNLSYSVIIPDAVANTVQINRINAYIQISVDKSRRKTVQFRLNGNVETEPGYVRSPAQLQPAMVTIQGPAQSVDAVEYAEVSLEKISPISKNLIINMPFTLMDADGKKVVSELMSVSADMVEVTFPVLKTKVIPLKLEMIDGGGLKQTQNIVCTYEPSEITVAGDAALLDVYNVCILGTINLAEITSDVSATYAIVPPNGIECNSGEKEAKVTINIQGVNTKLYSVKPMATGFEAPPGYILNFVTKELSVTLRGAPDALTAISSYNIRPIVNLHGVTIQPDSQQIVDVSIEIDGTDDVGVVGEYTVVVEVVLQDQALESESP